MIARFSLTNFHVVSLPSQLDLAARIDSLQSTLDQVRRETETEISRLRHELVDKNRTLERLQLQLQEQDNYDELKRQAQ